MRMYFAQLSNIVSGEALTDVLNAAMIRALQDPVYMASAQYSVPTKSLEALEEGDGALVNGTEHKSASETSDCESRKRIKVVPNVQRQLEAKLPGAGQTSG